MREKHPNIQMHLLLERVRTNRMHSASQFNLCCCKLAVTLTLSDLMWMYKFRETQCDSVPCYRQTTAKCFCQLLLDNNVDAASADTDEERIDNISNHVWDFCLSERDLFLSLKTHWWKEIVFLTSNPVYLFVLISLGFCQIVYMSDFWSVL